MSFFKNSFVAFCFSLLSVGMQNAFASEFPVSSEKKTFITELLKLSKQCDARILAERKKLLSLHEAYQKKSTLPSSQLAWLNEAAAQYKMKNWNPKNQNDWNTLLSRVDVVPPSLLLAQAAIESAWGTSRFATQGNNYFGQWCYQKGCGIVPLRRPENASYEVRKYPTPLLSVRSYVYNLNTNPTYHDFRVKRAAMREAKQPLSGRALAAGLGRYSQLGEAYVGMIRNVISRYQLNTYS